MVEVGTPPIEGQGSVPTNVPPAEPAGAPESGGSEFTIPEAYRGKDYLQGAKSMEDVFSMLDNAQTLIGKRPAGIPQENASQEEWDKFYQSMGRPEKPEDYQFATPEGVQVNEEFSGAMKKLLHGAGLSQKQAEMIQAGYDAFAAQSATQNDEQFEQLAKDTFGTDQEKVLATAKGLIAAHMPDTFKEHLETLDNKSLILLSGVLNNIQKKYIREDQLPSGGEPGGSPVDHEALRKEGRELMASPAFTNKSHPDHNRVAARVKQIYGT
jgi:hypothetical protein